MPFYRGGRSVFVPCPGPGLLAGWGEIAAPSRPDCDAPALRESQGHAAACVGARPLDHSGRSSGGEASGRLGLRADLFALPPHGAANEEGWRIVEFKQQRFRDQVRIRERDADPALRLIADEAGDGSMLIEADAPRPVEMETEQGAAFAHHGPQEMPPPCRLAVHAR